MHAVTPEIPPANVLGLLHARAIVSALHAAGADALARQVDDVIAATRLGEQLLVLPIEPHRLDLLRRGVDADFARLLRRGPVLELLLLGSAALPDREPDAALLPPRSRWLA